MDSKQKRWVNYPKLIKAVTMQVGTPSDLEYQKEIYVKCQNCQALVSVADVDQQLICKKCWQKQRVA
jgi:acetyl-CoA carboxylase beta subunit